MNNDEQTLQELAQESLDVQNACNSSGVAHSLVDIFARLHRLSNRGTYSINNHPIVVTFLDKLNSLAGIQPITGTAWERIAEADRICRGLANGTMTEVPESWE